MMSIGLHCRLARPGRVQGLADFIDFAKSYSRRDVWFCTREEIADYWYEHHFPFGASQTLGKGPLPSSGAEKLDTAAEEKSEEKTEEEDTTKVEPLPDEEEGDII